MLNQVKFYWYQHTLKIQKIRYNHFRSYYKKSENKSTVINQPSKHYAPFIYITIFDKNGASTITRCLIWELINNQMSNWLYKHIDHFGQLPFATSSLTFREKIKTLN